MGAAWGLGGGRHLAEGATRSGFAVLVGLCVGATVLFLSPLLSRSLRRRPRLCALGIALSLFGLELANQFVLPRLYPALHWGLAGLVLALAPWVALCLSDPAGARPRGWPTLLLLGSVGAALFIVPSAQRLAHSTFFGSFCCSAIRQIREPPPSAPPRL